MAACTSTSGRRAWNFRDRSQGPRLVPQRLRRVLQRRRRPRPARAARTAPAASRASDLARFQVNLTPANILTGSFLVNVARDTARRPEHPQPGGSHQHAPPDLFVRAPARPAVPRRRAAGGRLRRHPHGYCATCRRATSSIEITPFGNRGNYFVDTDRHSYRQQWIANLFLPTYHLRGAHQFKFGIDFEREAFHQKTRAAPLRSAPGRRFRGALRDFRRRARFRRARTSKARSTFRITGRRARDWSLEAGLRAEWNEIVRELELAPRFAAVWAPRKPGGYQVLRRLGHVLRRHRPGPRGAPAGPGQPSPRSTCPEARYQGPWTTLSG